MNRSNVAGYETVQGFRSQSLQRLLLPQLVSDYYLGFMTRMNRFTGSSFQQMLECCGIYSDTKTA